MQKFERYTSAMPWFTALVLSTLVVGCGGGGGGRDPILGAGDIGALVAPVAPAVTTVTPVNKATAIAINTKMVTAAFTKAMDASTLTSSSFTLACPATAPITGTTVSYLAAGQVATLALPAGTNLPIKTVCTATVTTGAKDMTGIALGNNFVWTFTTGEIADTTAPKVIATAAYPTGSATSGATGLLINRNSTATFSKAMDPTTICGASALTPACPVATYTLVNTANGLPVTGVVTYLGTTATFNPGTDLESNTTYRSTITNGARDLAGNALASNFVWTWTTGGALDNTPPTVTLTYPVDRATDVAIDKLVTASFSEEMKQATITTANFSVSETVSKNSVPGTVAYDVLQNMATFSPLSTLKTGTDYTVTVTNGATDLANNALVVPAVGGLPKPNPWTFKTVAAAPVVPPALAINLGSAASFGIASRAGLTSTGVTVVNGDVAIYPTPTCTDSTGNAGASQTCLVKTYGSPTGMSVNGSVFWAGDPFDSGATALSVTTALNAAWIEGKSKVPTMPTVTADELSSPVPYAPGIYHNATLGLKAGGLATFDAQGDVNATWIFQVDSSFVDSGTLLLPSQIILKNGAQARNVWFVTGLDITIGSGTSWNGNILAGRTATIKDGSTVIGRVLAGASGAGAITLTGAATPSVTTITVPH